MIIRERKQKKAEIDSSSPHQLSTGSILTPSLPSGYPATSLSYAIRAVPSSVFAPCVECASGLVVQVLSTAAQLRSGRITTMKYLCPLVNTWARCIMLEVIFLFTLFTIPTLLGCFRRRELLHTKIAQLPFRLLMLTITVVPFSPAAMWDHDWLRLKSMSFNLEALSFCGVAIDLLHHS